MADDLGYGDLGCYGATLVKTPNCDRIAEEGIRFTDAHSPSSVCSPTRYGVLTGRYCWRTSLKEWVCRPNDPLLIDTDRMTIASLLKSVGYTTGCIGKWHIGFGEKRPEWNYGELKPGPLEIGFDYYFGVPTSNNWPPYVYVENHKLFSHREYDVMVPNHRKDEEIGKTLAKKAVHFINNNRDKPFFLYFPTCSVHFPVTPHKDFVGTSKAGLYGDYIHQFDYSVGKVLEALDKHNLIDNTLIIVTSDNGAYPCKVAEHKSNGELRGQKAQIYEGGHRVPFITRWPGRIKAGTVSDEVICLTDFLATFAAIHGKKLPKNAGEDSYNILPALLGEKLDKPIREATVHHSVWGTFAIRRGPWKLIMGQTSGAGWPKPSGKLKKDKPAGQLYNLKSDPKETTNLYEERPEIVEKLTKLLEKYKRQGYSRSI